MNAYQQDYDDYLDEIYGSIQIANREYRASEILKEFDPISYNVGESDFLDSNWFCGECDTCYDNEEDAEHCCMHQCEFCFTWYEDETDCQECCQFDKEQAIKEELADNKYEQLRGC